MIDGSFINQEKSSVKAWFEKKTDVEIDSAIYKQRDESIGSVSW